MLAAAQLPAHAVAQVDPREMREAVQLEAADALREHGGRGMACGSAWFAAVF
jgi:hypothetical protein